MKEQIRLDDAIAAVRADEPQEGSAEAAAERVWARVAQEANLATGPVEAIRGCADVQALPEHQQGTLSGPRALLVEDHLGECAACRAALGGGPRLAVRPWRVATRRPSPLHEACGYAVAAVALLPRGGPGVQRVSLASRRAAGPPSSPSAASRSAWRRQSRRRRCCPAGSRRSRERAHRARVASPFEAARRLIVEMSERAELSVSVRGNDTKIRLERGRSSSRRPRKTGACWSSRTTARCT